MGEPPNEGNVLFYFVPFVNFVDELPYLGFEKGTLPGTVARIKHCWPPSPAAAFSETFRFRHHFPDADQQFCINPVMWL